MAKADGRIVIEINADESSAIKGIQNTQKAANGLSSTLKKLGGLLGGVFAVKAIVDFGKQAVELGSNVAEVQNVVDVAFGDMAYKVEAFADSAITNFGMSQLAAKKTASTYMAMAKNMGLSMEQASDMSITLAGLTGDVASFYNISQELADVKLKSVFTGETETLKDLGIVMTEANLQAYALSKGLSGNLQAMSQAEKVALRYNFVVDQLAQASGDFVRTQDGWANQTRILSMQWQELMSIIGQALIQVLLPVLRVLNQIVGALISMANAASAAFSTLFGSADKQIEQTASNAGAVGESIEGSVEGQEALTDAVKATNKEQKKSVASFDEINKLATETAGAAGAAAGGGNMLDIPGLNMDGMDGAAAAGGFGKLRDILQQIAEIASPLGDSFRDAFGRITPELQQFAGTIRGAWDDLAALGSPLLAWVSDDLIPLAKAKVDQFGRVFSGLIDSVDKVFGTLWDGVILPFFETLVDDILPVLTQLETEFTNTWTVIFEETKKTFDMLWEKAIAPALALIQQIWQEAWDDLHAAWDRWGAPIFDAIREAISGTGDTLRGIWENTVKPVFDRIMQVVDRLWQNHLQPLWNSILDFAGSLATAALNIYNNFILPIVGWVGELLGPIVAATIGAIVELVGGLVADISDAVTWLLDVCTDMLNVLSDIFGPGMKRVLEIAKETTIGMLNALIAMVESFVNLFIKGINRIISALNTIQVSIPEWVPGLGGSVFGINLPKISEIQLPRLATGAVVPPNREFMAVLGDNKEETEVVSPLSTMKQAFLEALRESGGAGGEQIVVLEVDGREFGRAVFKANKTESRRIGMQLAGV